MPDPSPQKLLPAISIGVALLAAVLVIGSRVPEGLWLGLALALLTVFGMIWVLGIRYPDVGWMVVAIALAELGAVHPLFGGARVALVGALGAFLLTFFRMSFRPGRLEAGFLALVLAYGAARALLPEDLRAASGLEGALPSYAMAVILAYAAGHGLWILRALPAKRRRYVALVSAACTAGVPIYVASARGGLPSEAAGRADFAYVTIFALFVVADLVVFHRSYYREKASRMAAARQDDLEARLELGRSVQELLLSKERSGRFGGFAYEIHFQQALRQGGDWFWAWEVGTEKRFFVGEVGGNGPQSTLAVAAVMGFLHEGRARGLGLAGMAAYVHQRLGTLFERQVTTTFLAISADRDGTVELLNCGGPGFFSVSRDGCRHWALPSTPLGAGDGFEAAGCPLSLADGDVLFAGNAGLLGPGATAKVLAYFEDDMDLRLDALRIRLAVIEAAAPDAGSDQTLLTIQKSAA